MSLYSIISRDPFKQSEIRSDYYDTQDWTLSEHDFALRVTMLSNMQVAVLKKAISGAKM
jgi:inorganic triphosphatase YgiF